MLIPDTLANLLEKTLDNVYALMPQTLPSKAQILDTKIIAHRGIHTFPQQAQNTFLENTLESFEEALKHKIWGIEFDIRWTKDHEPVVLHDLSLKRTFGKNNIVSDLRFTELREIEPRCPHLSEMVERFGKKIHLYIEIKQHENLLNGPKQNRLLQILEPLAPLLDYTLLVLNPEILKSFPQIDKSHCYLVALLNENSLSPIALEQKFGGLMGHYFFLSDKLVRAHKYSGQKVGTGFVSSRNCLKREITRGIDFIFTNHALKVKAELDRMREH